MNGVNTIISNIKHIMKKIVQGDHKPDAAPWPEGCLLYPRRLPWRRLRHIKAQTPDRFEVLYQQSDVNPANVLVDPLWVSGGVGKDGVHHPGCWDNDRDLWELPQNVSGDMFVVATADPSPANFWAINVGRTTQKQSSGIC